MPEKQTGHIRALTTNHEQRTRNISVTLGEYFNDFADQQVKNGKYASVSEVVRAGLRLLNEREIRMHNLREAIREGEESGPPRRYDSFDQFLHDVMPNTGEKK
jgi:antitoxin ParD1/3/4